MSWLLHARTLPAAGQGRAYWGREVVTVGHGERTKAGTEQRADLEHRVHVDLPRVRPEDMVATQDVDPPPDPQGGRDTETEFMLRNAGW